MKNTKTKQKHNIAEAAAAAATDIHIV